MLGGAFYRGFWLLPPPLRPRLRLSAFAGAAASAVVTGHPNHPMAWLEVSHDAPCAKATFRVHVALGTCSPRHHEVRRQPRVAGFEAYLCRTMRCTLKLTGASHWVPSPAPFLGRLGAPCSSEINISPTATLPNQRISGPE